MNYSIINFLLISIFTIGSVIGSDSNKPVPRMPSGTVPRISKKVAAADVFGLRYHSGEMLDTPDAPAQELSKTQQATSPKFKQAEPSELKSTTLVGTKRTASAKRARRGSNETAISRSYEL